MPKQFRSLRFERHLKGSDQNIPLYPG